MYPDQQNQQPAPNYDFIMNSNQRPKRSFGAPSSKAGRIGLIAGLVAVVFIMVMVFGSVVSSASNKGGRDLADLVAYQSELSRILALGNERTRDSGLRIKSVTASYTLKTHYQASAGLIKKRGIKVDKKSLAKYNGTQNDALLNQADKSNTFDTAYQAIYNEKLTAYQAKLSSIYPHLSKKEQSAVKAMNEATKTLLL